jgi:hypothetical protein
MLRAFLPALLLASLTTSALAQTLVVTGAEGQNIALNAADFAALPRESVTLVAHGQTRVYEGPLLIDILAKVGAPTGKSLRGPALAQVVLVEAADGYAVAMGLAESDPGTRAHRVILADKADGAPLSAAEGPVRLVVEGDLRPARSARMVHKISILQLKSDRSSGTPHRR